MKVLITRPRHQSEAFGAALQAAGFEPVYFPVIEIRPLEDNTALDRALGKIGCYDWLIFTSVNGVEMVRSRPPFRLPLPESLRVAAIGPKTASALREIGIQPFFVPEEYVAEAILPGLGDLRGRWVLLPRAEIARKALPEAIARSGGVAHEIAVYRTLPSAVDAQGLVAIASGVDVLTFTSPSTVQNFAEIIRREGLDPLSLPGNPRVACIGPITQKAARDEGFRVDIVAAEYTTEGLIEALSKQVAG